MRVVAEGGLPIPPDEAWPILVDWELQPAWMRDAAAVSVESPQRAGVGTRIAVATRVFGVRALTDRLEVVEWAPPHRLVMAHRGLIGGTGTWTLSPAGSGSRFAWTEDIRVTGPGSRALGEIALGAYRPFMRRLMGAAMIELRRLIDQRRELV